MSLLHNYRRPVNIVALINLLAFTLLYFYQKTAGTNVIIAGCLMLGLVYLSNILMVLLKFEDEILFLIVSMLSSLGIVMLFRLDPAMGLKQIIWFAGGNILFFVSAFIYQRIKFWDRLMYVYLLGSFVLFMATLIFGRTVKGATNWILIGGFSFQPSEIIKLLFIFFIASYFSYPKKLEINFTFKQRKIHLEHQYVFMFLAYLHMGFLVLQRELGTALLFFCILIIFLYVFDGRLRHILANLGVAFLGGWAGYLFIHHVRVRVTTWLNPWADAAGKGYQITQSLFAIGAGGFFGSGIGLGLPEYIPEVNTDFIFSAICEEMGIFGGIAVVLLFFILVYRGIKITLAVKNSFYKATALGISVMFAFQSFIIIGGVIRLIPLTGITLPFISYGGSSLIESFIALGIMQAISAKSVAEEGNDEREQENY